MTELTDERLAEMWSRYHGEGMPSPWQIRDDLGAALAEITRLRAARAELVEGLRPFAREMMKFWPDDAWAFHEGGPKVGDCRRAAELVARHGGQPPADVDHATGS